MLNSDRFSAVFGQFVDIMQGDRWAQAADERQNVQPWGRLIKSSDKVPEVYRAAFDALLAGTDRFPHTVFVPPCVGVKNRPEGRLICCLNGGIHLLEVVGSSLVSTVYPVEKISRVQAGLVLLCSWIGFQGVTADGVETSTEIRFNTVTDYLFTPIVKWIRSTPEHSETVDRGAELDRFDYLEKLNFKLMNYSRRSIAPGDHVVQTLFQPEIRISAFKAFWLPFFRKLFAPHVVILTDRELILIKDGSNGRFGKDIRHGGVWDYIPLDKITAVTVTADEDDLQTLSIHLPGDDHVDCVFSASLKPDLDLLQSRLASTPKDLPAPAAP